MVAMEITIISIARSQIAAAFPNAEAATLSWVCFTLSVLRHCCCKQDGWPLIRTKNAMGISCVYFLALYCRVLPSPEALDWRQVVQSIEDT